MDPSLAPSVLILPPHLAEGLPAYHAMFPRTQRPDMAAKQKRKAASAARRRNR